MVSPLIVFQHTRPKICWLVISVSAFSFRVEGDRARWR